MDPHMSTNKTASRSVHSLCTVHRAQIADLSPLTTANGFVRCWPFLIHGSLGPQESDLKQHLDQFSCFEAAHARDFHAFKWAGQPQKLPPSPWGSEPHLTHGALCQSESTTKQNLDWFSRFCKTHKHDQHTDTHTHTHRPTTLLHLQQQAAYCAMHVKRPKNIRIILQSNHRAGCRGPHSPEYMPYNCRGSRNCTTYIISSNSSLIQANFKAIKALIWECTNHSVVGVKHSQQFNSDFLLCTLS